MSNMPENKNELVVSALAQLQLINQTFSQVAGDDQMSTVWNAIITATHDSQEAIEYLLDVLTYICNANDVIGDNLKSIAEYINDLGEVPDSTENSTQ